ncbi:MAG: tRNA dihydrouridine synthase DusB [Candidatus Woesearchaeota archaeon]|nr:tRNA dihydrouridine synthase DusB [Candidatus Woesearchaeota archaeon]
MLIGPLDIRGKVVLAPMCEVTKLPFRLICKRYGAAIVYTEMIHADAYIMGAERTKKRAMVLEEERPVGIQIVGSSLEKLKKAAVMIEKDLKPDILDINIGCPAYNVMKTGSGSALLKDLDKLSEIVRELSSSVKIPFTCKIRVLEKDEDTLKAAGMIEKSGAAALTVHGRTARQGYSGKANWDIIRKIKQQAKIPIILNGDITDEASASNALETTGCDAVMIGRAAIKNPFIIKQISHFLDTGEALKNTFQDKLKDYEEIISLYERYGIDDLTALKLLAQNFTKGEVKGSIFRRRISEAKTIDEIKAVFDR